MSCRLAPLIRVKSTRLLGVPVPNLIMGNVPKRAGVSGNAMAMKADLTWDNVEFWRFQTGLPVIIKRLRGRLVVQSWRAPARQHAFGHDGPSARCQCAEGAASDHH